MQKKKKKNNIRKENGKIAAEYIKFYIFHLILHTIVLFHYHVCSKYFFFSENSK